MTTTTFTLSENRPPSLPWNECARCPNSNAVSYWRHFSSWYLIATPIAAGVSVLWDFEIFGKHYSGFIWFFLLLVGLYLLAVGGIGCALLCAWRCGAPG